MDPEDRKRIRCKACRLVQFVSKAKQCVRCHAGYGEAKTAVEPVTEPAPKPIMPQVVQECAPSNLAQRSLNWLPVVLRYQRQYLGMSQRELAGSRGWPRTYVNRIEAGSARLGIKNLPLYCAALETTPAHVFRMAEYLVEGK